MNDTEARSVLVTGASRGIGRAVAEAFVAAGDRVATIYRGGELPQGVLGVRGDMRDTAAVDAAIGEIEEAHGPVEVLVANAGMTRDQLLMRMTDEEFEEVLDVNLTGVFRCVRRVSKGMIRKRAGRIILMGSVVGMYGNAGQVNYAATKAGLVGMARSITRELGSRGITATDVAQLTSPAAIARAADAKLGAGRGFSGNAYTDHGRRRDGALSRAEAAHLAGVPIRAAE